MNSRINFMMHPCAVTPIRIQPPLTILHFCDRTETLLLQRTMNTYNANGCIVVTYLFKDVIKEAEHIKKIMLINVKYNSNVQMMTSIYDNNLFLIIL